MNMSMRSMKWMAQGKTLGAMFYRIVSPYRATIIAQMKGLARMMSTAAMLLPSPPSRVLTAFGTKLQTGLAPDLQEIITEQAAEDGNRDAMFALQRKIAVSTNKLLDCVRNGELEHFAAQSADCKDMQLQMLECIRHDAVTRESRASNSIERALIPNLLFGFFSEGSIPTQRSFGHCNDDEYIGALTGFAQELHRYAVNRAIENDVSSIEMSRQAVVQLNEALLGLDFRNGPLRRKYDGVKYAVRAIEGAAFELSLTDNELASQLFVTQSTSDEEQDSKRARLSSSSSGAGKCFLDLEEVAQIQQRMEKFDQCREQVIKDCRDVQKLSKQAIFALQRGTLDEAQAKLTAARAAADKIVALVEGYPTLRVGALSNALEEWAEGALLLQWLSTRSLPSRSTLNISAAEYIGGLSDFTGEIGRIAVALAARRDLPGVREIQQADMAVAHFIAAANVGGGKYTKKLEAVQTNLRKVEDIVYELVLQQRSQRAVRVRADVPPPPPPTADDTTD